MVGHVYSTIIPAISYIFAVLLYIMRVTLATFPTIPYCVFMLVAALIALHLVANITGTYIDFDMQHLRAERRGQEILKVTSGGYHPLPEIPQELPLLMDSRT